MKSAITLATTGRAAFWGLSLLIAVGSLRWLLAPIAAVMPDMQHYTGLVPLALYGHILFAPLALALAPLQLWQGLRSRRPRLHRAIGYGYAMSVLIAGLSSLALLPHFLGSIWAGCGFFLLAVLWIGCTARGVWLARAGEFAAHRRWMVRSIALTFGAVTLRLLMAPLMAAGWSVTETYEITAWASWLLSLAAVEIWPLRRALQKGTPSGAL